LRSRSDNEFDALLFDPPYSPRQVSECYKKQGLSVNMQTTQASFWSNIKTQIQRVCAPGAVVVTCGWNSGGIGKGYGFCINRILLVAHGGWHNDTIVTVETAGRKNNAAEAVNTATNSASTKFPTFEEVESYINAQTFLGSYNGQPSKIKLCYDYIVGKLRA